MNRLAAIAALLLLSACAAAPAPVYAPIVPDVERHHHRAPVEPRDRPIVLAPTIAPEPERKPGCAVMEGGAMVISRNPECKK